MKAGDIFYCPKFEFKNGEIGKKLLILLNNPTPENKQPYSICKTTSQPKNKSYKPYCQEEDNLFLLRAQADFFQTDTWLQLYELYLFTQEEFINLKFKNDLKPMGSLKDVTMRQIRNCIKKCKDISRYNKELICG